MDEVRLKKDELLQVLVKNFNEHMKEHEEAFDIWRAAKLIELKNWREDLANGKEIPDHSTLVKPICYAKEYERAILMVKMSVDVQIELSEQDFSRYIMDEWDWVSSFKNVNTFYKSAQFRQ